MIEKAINRDRQYMEGTAVVTFRSKDLSRTILLFIFSLISTYLMQVIWDDVYDVENFRWWVI